MTVLSALLDATRTGGVRVVDLTTPLQESTPILQLPEPFANTSRFRLEELSRYDEKGPGWYWNDIHTGEHTGTHLDAPVHWITGKAGYDVAQAPLSTLVAPAVVIDKSGEADGDADFLLQIDHVRAWETEHGPLPDGGWLLYRTGWDARGDDAGAFANGSHTPGVAPDCARWLARETPIAGLGVETVGTDAGQAPALEPAFPCHTELMGANKWGLTSLRNLGELPPTGVVLIVCPLPIVGGSGSRRAVSEGRSPFHFGRTAGGGTPAYREYRRGSGTGRHCSKNRSAMVWRIRVRRGSRQVSATSVVRAADARFVSGSR